MKIRTGAARLCAFALALSLLASCSAKEYSSEKPENESKSVAELKSEKASQDNTKLVVAGSEIACGVDPTVYPAADYLLNMGAAEILFKVDADGIIKPSLAKQAVQLDDYTWKIELRPEAVFWSKAPVTAEAVISSLMRSKELDMKASPYLADMEFSVIDDYTIKVVTKSPNTDIKENLSYSQLVIHNTSAEYSYEDINSADYTGMYKISSFEPAMRMTFEKNENYWGKKPQIQTIVHEQIGDSDARVMAAMSGQYHVVLDIDRASCKQIDESDVSHIVMVPGAQTMTIYLNTQNEALADYRVRQALAWGIDREELIMLGMEGLSEPVTTWLGSNPAYKDIKNAFFTGYDPQKAEKLLDEAGWKLSDDQLRYKDGKQLKMLIRTFRNDKALGEAIQIQWRKLGVNASVKHGDYSLMSTAYENGDWEAAVEGWGAYGNVVGLLKTQYAPDGAANYGKYKDEKVDELLKNLAEAPNSESRHQAGVELSLYIAEKSPAIYICPRPQITAVSNKLEGFVPHFRQFENVVNADLRIGL